MKNWDVFICHASEDKKPFVRALATALKKRGLKVWYDEFVLKLGDDLRREIDRGLAESAYGIVVLSKAFFAKGWTHYELDGLIARDLENPGLILFVWHGVDADYVRKFSPSLSMRRAVKTSEGLRTVVSEILRVIMPDLRLPPRIGTEIRRWSRRSAEEVNSLEANFQFSCPEGQAPEPRLAEEQARARLEAWLTTLGQNGMRVERAQGAGEHYVARTGEVAANIALGAPQRGYAEGYFRYINACVTCNTVAGLTEFMKRSSQPYWYVRYFLRSKLDLQSLVAEAEKRCGRLPSSSVRHTVGGSAPQALSCSYVLAHSSGGALRADLDHGLDRPSTLTLVLDVRGVAPERGMWRTHEFFPLSIVRASIVGCVTPEESKLLLDRALEGYRAR